MKIELFGHEELNIVEFNSGEKPAVNGFCKEDSKFLHGSVFSIIHNAFELSNKEYSYYNLTGFSDGNLIRLRNHLQDHYSRLKSISTIERFDSYLFQQVEGIDFLNELKTFYPKWKITWESIQNQLLKVYEEILEMIDLCIDNDTSFWVKGY